MSEDVSGIIFNVQRFSTHDGPGIRDTIFLKGCPLRCVWCANPESQAVYPELAYKKTKCISCLACYAACPEKAISPGVNGNIQIDRQKCRRCFTCTKVCCAKAMEQVGEKITAKELVDRVMKQHLAWRSESGITLSGGEPLRQPEFAAELLKLFRREGIDTAIETCGCVPYNNFRMAAPWLKTMYFDLKCMDTGLHKKYTGADNTQILNNLKSVREEFPGLHIIVRTPLIPGFNDTRENLDATAQYLKSIGIKEYELLPYHNYGENKYYQLGRDYELKELVPQDKAAVKELNKELLMVLNSRE